MPYIPGQLKTYRSGNRFKSLYGADFWFRIALLLPTLFFTGSNLFEQNINIYVVGYMMLIPMFLGYVLFGYGLKLFQQVKQLL